MERKVALHNSTNRGDPIANYGPLLSAPPTAPLKRPDVPSAHSPPKLSGSETLLNRLGLPTHFSGLPHSRPHCLAVRDAPASLTEHPALKVHQICTRTLSQQRHARAALGCDALLTPPAGFPHQSLRARYPRLRVKTPPQNFETFPSSGPAPPRASQKRKESRGNFLCSNSTKK